MPLRLAISLADRLVPMLAAVSDSVTVFPAGALTFRPAPSNDAASATLNTTEASVAAIDLAPAPPKLAICAVVMAAIWAAVSVMAKPPATLASAAWSAVKVASEPLTTPPVAVIELIWAISAVSSARAGVTFATVSEISKPPAIVLRVASLVLKVATETIVGRVKLMDVLITTLPAASVASAVSCCAPCVESRFTCAVQLPLVSGCAVPISVEPS